MTEFFFWFSVLLILYTYAGYPAVLFFMGLLFPKQAKPDSGTEQPKVSVVIAARNEAGRIAKRLRNLLEQDYPQDRMEIIVVSDGSMDATAVEVREFAKVNLAHGVRLIELPESRGKPAALNAGVSAAKGDLIVFADSRQDFERTAVSALVSNFSDPKVGCVSGELFLVDPDGGTSVEMGAYWAYEKWIRKAESRSGSVVGATGAIYAIRKGLYQELPEETLLDDVLTPLGIVMQGYRVVYEGRAEAYDRVSANVQQEWRRKVRTLVGNWQLLRLKPVLLSPKANPVLFRFLSHKIMRLVVPFLMMLAFGVNLFLPLYPYPIFLAVQIACYGAAAAAAAFPVFRRVRLLNLLYFFCILNAAAVVAFVKFASGQTGSLWGRQSPGVR